MTSANSLPIVIIGAGPVGLAAAAHLIEKGERPLIIEAGDDVGASVSQWGHVRLFSPWRYCIDQAAERLLKRTNWQSPDPDSYPTGNDLVQQYLLPLSRTPQLANFIQTNLKVTSVSRLGLDKMSNAERTTTPFDVRVQSSHGVQRSILARAVIDASGTYTSPNPIGSGGVPAIGELEAQNTILYRIPDVHGIDQDRFKNRSVAVVGSGHSAFNALIELAELAKTHPQTQVAWIVRKTDLSTVYGGEHDDALAERGALGSKVKALVQSGEVQLHSGFRITSVEQDEWDGTILVSDDSRKVKADQVVATTGFRPDLSILSEVRLDLHPAVESPSILADMIDPNFHSCGTVDPHGAEELAHPEKDFYIVGMKSYGRAPTFLMLTGYEQVRSIACELTGDFEGARNLELVLPETGVCSGDGCCAPPPTRKTISARPSLTILSTPLKVTSPKCDPSTGCCEP